MRTVGVEEELLLVDPESGRPRAVAAAVLRVAEEHRDRGAPASCDPGGTVEAELQQQQLEIDTRPAEDVADVLTELRRFREHADLAAQAVGTRAVALATSPLDVSPQLTPKPRYQRLADRFGRTTTEQLTCGCHVHVAVESDDEAVAVLDRIRIWLPLLVAMSANSPYWQGADSGYQSYRYQAWGSWPSSGPTELFGSAGAYHDRVAAILATDEALDQGMIYFDARVAQSYPTVELRVADVCLDVSDTALLAALSRALVETAARDWQRGEQAPPVPAAVLRMAAWRASRDGLTGDLVDPLSGRPRPAADVLASMLRHLAPALQDAGDLARAEHGVARLISDGSGASVQRDAVRADGGVAAAVRAAVERTHQVAVPHRGAAASR